MPSLTPSPKPPRPRSAGKRARGRVLFVGELLHRPATDPHARSGRPTEDPLPCYRGNRDLPAQFDDGECRHCRNHLTLRCPYIDDFLDDLDDG